jgi:outer membrane protein assembly factor BamD
MRRVGLVALLGGLLLFAGACSNKKSVNPLAGIGSKQPDKVLFDRAMEAMKHNRFDVARMTLQTLINTYPDSEFVARAKLAVGDSWYAEGGTASLAQAEQEYRDFETFFPNMPEAAEAQLKIANIQYQQMEKADRDFTHAKRAEDEYRTLVMQYPDNTKMVAEGKQRLLEVQEVLAEREFEIGRFYYLRQSYPASMARLQSLMDKYPLYSKADEALYLLGQNHEAQIARVRAAPNCTAAGPQGCVNEAVKAKLIDEQTREAAEDYSRIITRYPIMDRVDDAKRRLAALHQPIPRPTKAAVAQNKAEDASRRDSGMFGRLMGVVRKGPDVETATKVGEPTLQEPTPLSAQDVTQRQLRAITGTGGGEKGLTIEKVDASGVPDANEPAPRSDRPAPAGGSPFAQPAAPAADPNELTPTAAAASSATPDPNELKPTADASAGAPLPPPPQINEIQQGGAQAASSSSSSSSATAGSDANAEASDKDLSTSKKKKKKGLKRIVPF